MAASRLEPHEKPPVINQEGVDTSLVATTLAMSPEERLEHNDRMVAMIQELRRGFASLED